MNIQHRNERYFEEDIWVMDSECCSKCGCILDEFETDLCGDCWQDQQYTDGQDFYDGWGSDWDLPLEETGKP
jgi:hypothetical protein